jgi:Anti-sigma-K factor rskA, C-terminal/Anti-sigma-K factor RskA, N-terminal domain
VSNRDHDLHLLTGAYALDALDRSEYAQFERHLTRCPSCQEEVRGLRETAARLAMGTAIQPPPEMRQRVLAAAAQTRQLPPGGRVIALRNANQTARRRLTRPLTMAAMTAMAAAIVLLLVLQVGTRNQLNTTQARSQAVAAVLSAPDARIQTGGTSVGGTVTAVISASHQEAVVTTADLPALSGNRVYQLWVITQAGARSAGLLPGATTPVLADGVSGGAKLGITVEPAGGTTRPTTTPIILLPAQA